MKNNISNLTFYRLYFTGFLLILFLPLLAFPPLFFPPEWGKMIAFRVVLSLIFFLLLWQIISSENFFKEIIQRYKIQKKPIWILCFIMLIIVLSTIVSLDITFSLWSSPHRSGGAVNFIFSILLSITLFLLVKEQDWKKLFDFSFLVADLVVLFAAIQYFNLLPTIFIGYSGRPPSTLSNPILLGIYLILLTFPLVSFIIKEKFNPVNSSFAGINRARKSIFYWVSLVLILFGIFISGSRAAYLGLVIGGLYFFLFYPKKLLKMKLILLCITILIASGILYISFTPKLPHFIENSPRLSFLANRISMQNIMQAVGQTRFSAWQTFFKAVKEKPLFGWGAENQSIAFDTYYNPDLSYLVKLGEDWWDRAHDIFLDLSISYGILFLLLYLFFFIYLFWRLQKNKVAQPNKSLASHAVQATFLSYFVALIFGFDSVTTYLTLFFIIGYTLYLIAPSAIDQSQQVIETKAYYSLFKKRKAIIGVALILLILFLWQYSLKPLIINAKISSVEKLNCRDELNTMEKLLSERTFIDSYLRLKYVEDVKTCSSYIIDNESEYLKKVVNALKDAVKIQPRYTRSWILLTQFNNSLLSIETNPDVKASLKKDSQYYVSKAKQLSPKRQEVFVAEAEIYFVVGDFDKMKKITKDCIAIDKDAAYCYWYLGLSELLLGDEKQGSQDIETAKEKGHDYNNRVSLSQLALAYSKNKNYKALVSIYSQLTEIDPHNIDLQIQDHATLASLYKELGDYKNARKEALQIIKLNPDAKSDVEDFLNTLPY